MTEMRRKVAELFAYMDSTRASLFTCAQEMNASFASIRPRDGQWSAAENMAHLAKVERNVAEMMSRVISAAREQGIGPDTSEESFINSLDAWRVSEALTKLSAPERIVPEQGTTVGESIASLEASRARLKQLILDNSDIDLSAVKRTHPVLQEIDMFQWALFIAQHEERHRKQMERTIAEVTERAAECAPIV
jgi:hypothetical protein